MFAGVLGVQLAFAIGKAGDEGAAAFLSEDIAVRQAVFLEGTLDDLGKPAAGGTEEGVAGVDDFLHRVLTVVLGGGRPGNHQRGEDEGRK
ncbi:hypothetical protein ACVIRM_004635 [Rhizobium laguerreae]